MGSITTPDIDDNLKQRLMERAVKRGHSMEVEARDILEDALAGKQPAAVPDNLYDAIRAIVEPLGGIELESFRPEPVRDPLRFD